MKKFTYLATALLVLAGASSCQKNADVQEPGLQPSGKMRTVTIQAGQGATKTSVNNGKLTWTAGDELTIVPQSGSIDPAALEITGGEGTANGTFTGVIDAAIEDNTPLYGYAGGEWSYSSGTFTVNMPATQTYVSNGLAEDAYPSIGSGTIQNGITLSNPFGVLKLNVKGATTDLIKSITVTSTANNLAGSFTVVPGGSVSGGSSKTITLGSIPNVALSASGVAFYVVVPAGSYAANDLTVTVTKSDDTKLFDCTLDATTVTASNATSKDVEDSSEDEYGKCKASLYEQVTIGTQTWMAENYKCRKYDTNAIEKELTAEFIEAHTDAKGNVAISSPTSSLIKPYYIDATNKSTWSFEYGDFSENLTDAQIAKLGYLYNWDAAVGVLDYIYVPSFTNRQGICPNDWHLPSASDWNDLKTYIEETDGKGAGTAGKHLKSTSGWFANNGTDNYGFAGLPSGFYVDGTNLAGATCNFWSTSKTVATDCGVFSLSVGSDELSGDAQGAVFGMSIRCLKN